MFVTISVYNSGYLPLYSRCLADVSGNLKPCYTFPFAEHYSSLYSSLVHRFVCGSLALEQLAVIVLFDAATLDGWTDGLYTAMYGCAQYGDPQSCNPATVGFSAISGGYCLILSAVALKPRVG